jgi:alanine dehydrogenase
MIVGVPREIKDGENRVGMTPAGVEEMKKQGHAILVEKNAGAGSGFSDEEYKKKGAQIVDSPEEVYKKSGMIIKVKEPLGKEHEMLHEDQILFTYLHLAACKDVAEMLVEKKVTGIAYETVSENGFLPLLAPMSEVAGRMSLLIAGTYLSKHNHGKGILLPGVPGTKAAKVVVLGGGFAGCNAARIAYGVGAEVTIIEKSIPRIRQLKESFPYARVLVSNSHNVTEQVKSADAVIGAVLVPGASAPKLLSKENIESIEDGSVFVDIAIDQGGCSETSKPTSHSRPVYDVSGVTHYCVTNMPAAYPRTSTIALTNATLQYAIELACKGLNAVKASVPLQLGVNTFKGKITCKPVAEALGMECVELKL